jgi:hypothetical protein
MPFPQVYQRESERAIASYNYVDIASGTGFVIFYAHASEVAGGLDYHLNTESSIYSSLIETDAGFGAPPQTIDLDFDLSSFNLPQTLEGEALVNFTITAHGGTGTTASSSAVVTIRKWDGTTETDIATATTPSVSSGVASLVKELMTIPITVPRTLFKKGETLRLNITVTITRTGGSNEVKGTLGHDPRNRDGAVIIPSTDSPDTITQIAFHAPFKIDL